MPIIETEITLM